MNFQELRYWFRYVHQFRFLGCNESDNEYLYPIRKQASQWLHTSYPRPALEVSLVQHTGPSKVLNIGLGPRLRLGQDVPLVDALVLPLLVAEGPEVILQKLRWDMVLGYKE